MTGNPNPVIIRLELGHCNVQPCVPTGFNNPAWTYGGAVYLPGEFLWMEDGSCWFHPYRGNGMKPVQVDPERRLQILEPGR